MTTNPTPRDLPGEVDELHQAVERLAGMVQQVATTVTEHVTTDRTTAPSWLDLPTGDPGAAHQVLDELMAWLHTVFLRYPDATGAVPECWLWHPDVVEELVWLSHAWHAAYTAPTATAALAGDWHDRYRPGVIERLKKTAGGCSLERHDPTGATTPCGVPVADAAAAIADWWATHRTEPAPAPTTQDYDAATAWHTRTTTTTRRRDIRTA